MAGSTKPMTPVELVKALSLWGVKIQQPNGWSGHRRDPAHGSWGPMAGIGIHHTGDDSPDDRSADMLWAGRSDLPGPLATWGMRDDGVAVMLSGGRSNHFGSGSASTLEHVQREDYTGAIKPGPDGVDGNTRFYGQETMYSGGHPMTLLAYQASVRAFAAVCDFHGWSAHHCIGHKEWTRRKIDPRSFDMKTFRRDVQRAINAGPGNWPEQARVKPLIPEITAARVRLRSMSANTKRPRIKGILINADKQLAKIERG